MMDFVGFAIEFHAGEDQCLERKKTQELSSRNRRMNISLPDPKLDIDFSESLPSFDSDWWSQFARKDPRNYPDPWKGDFSLDRCKHAARRNTLLQERQSNPNRTIEKILLLNVRNILGAFNSIFTSFVVVVVVAEESDDCWSDFVGESVIAWTCDCMRKTISVLATRSFSACSAEGTIFRCHRRRRVMSILLSSAWNFMLNIGAYSHPSFFTAVWTSLFYSMEKNKFIWKRFRESWFSIDLRDS